MGPQRLRWDVRRHAEADMGWNLAIASELDPAWVSGWIDPVKLDQHNAQLPRSAAELVIREGKGFTSFVR
jgi:hypothetical protein